MDSKIAKVQELLREAYAILATFEPPNIRTEVQHHENLALLADSPKPGPLPPVGPPIVVIEEPAQEVE